MPISNWRFAAAPFETTDGGSSASTARVSLGLPCQMSTSASRLRKERPQSACFWKIALPACASARAFGRSPRSKSVRALRYCSSADCLRVHPIPRMRSRDRTTATTRLLACRRPSKKNKDEQDVLARPSEFDHTWPPITDTWFRCPRLRRL